MRDEGTLGTVGGELRERGSLQEGRMKDDQGRRALLEDGELAEGGRHSQEKR